MTLLVLFVLVGLLDLAVYGGFVKGEDAVTIQSSAAANEASRAEHDDRAGLPGMFVPNQGRKHTGSWPLAQRVPFCRPDAISDECYASNPPTSGLHVGVQQGARIDAQHTMNIPPDPGIYDFEIPREVIPHIEEHGGVFLGYNCLSADCREAVRRARGVVEQELALGARVVMSPDSDLEANTIALAAWTRVDSFSSVDYSDERARAFIKAHSCRFDPEGFCKGGVSVN